MYAHCFFGKYTHLTEMCTRLLPSAARYEEGIRDQMHREDGSHSSRKKRRRNRDAMSGGLEEIAEVLRPQNIEAAGKREEAESDRAKFLAVDAMDQSTKSLLSAIKDATHMLQSATSEEDIGLYKAVVTNLSEQLRTSTSQQ